jgi:hypothetical protein
LLHGRQDGAFAIAEDQGPMPGPHEVQIRWISRQASYDASGKYSMEQSLICVRNAVIAPDQPLDIRLRQEDFVPSNTVKKG